MTVHVKDSLVNAVYGNIIYFQNHIQHANTTCGQYAALLNVKSVVHTVTTGPYMFNIDNMCMYIYIYVYCFKSLLF
jgi:hypothetical protein